MCLTVATMFNNRFAKLANRTDLGRVEIPTQPAIENFYERRTLIWIFEDNLFFHLSISTFKVGCGTMVTKRGIPLCCLLKEGLPPAKFAQWLGKLSTREALKIIFKYPVQ